MNEEWTKEDAAEAVSSGWNLYPVWDMGKQRIEQVIQCAPGSPFKTDEIARGFVNTCIAAGNKIATKAARIAFVSCVGSVKPKRKKK